MSDDDDDLPSASDSDSDDSVKSDKTHSTRSVRQLLDGEHRTSTEFGRLQRGATLAELRIGGTNAKTRQRIDGKFIGKLMEYIRVGDERNVRRLLNKMHRSSAAALCVRPVKAAHRWSALTSAADSGHADIVTLLVAEYNADATHLDGNGWTPLHAAVRKSHCHVIRSLVQSVTSLDMNTSSRDGWTPLHIGIRKSAAKTVDLILRYGADVNLAGPRGWTALHLAALVGRRDLVEILVQHGARAYALTDDTQSTPVHVATQNGYTTTVEQLLADVVDAGDCNSLKRLTNVDGWTALHMAAASGHVDVVRHLVEHNHSPEVLNLCNKDGCTALYLAVQNGHAAIAQFLLQKSGVDVNMSRNELQWSPLGVAVDKADTPLVNMLVEATTSVEFKKVPEGGAQHAMLSTTGRVISPLHVALFNRNIDLVRRLVASGVDVNDFYGGVTACHLAAVVDTTTANYIDALLRPESHRDDVTCDVNARDAANGRTPLHYAVLRGNDRAVRSLLGARDVELDAVDGDNWTALVMAAQRGSTDVVQMLLAAGCDVNRATRDGYTALHMAVKARQFDLVRLLIDFQADVKATADSERLQPIHLAAGSADEPILELLINAGADVTATTQVTQRTCLHLAALHGNTQTVDYLLRAHSQRCHVNATSSGGWTPLHMACQAGCGDAVAELLRHGADDRSTLDDDGETALYVAAAHGRRNAAEILLEQTTVCRKMTSRTGWTELHAAAARGHTDTIDVLVKHLGTVNERSRLTGETALHVAARMGHVDTVRVLVDGGADCEARCAGGLSPLYVAASAGHADVVRLLVELGPSVVDVGRLNGSMLQTALHVAGNAPTAMVLINHGAKDDVRDGPGRTPLKQAMHDNRVEVVKLLEKLRH